MRKENRRWRFAAFATAVLCVACTAFAQRAEPKANSEQFATGAPALKLDAGDLLEITTFDTPELSGRFRVDSRGYVTLPIGGGVPVQGLTAEQAGTAIARFLRDRDILKNPT